MPDRNFDDLAEHFSRKIYSSDKGEIRLQLIQRELLAVCPQLQGEKPLRVIDIGGGLGQLSAFVANLGHQVVLCDISENMLRKARELIAKTSSDALPNIDFVHAPLQQISNRVSEGFDLVLFHAVLEWLEQPRQGLQAMLPLLNEQGVLSLMFYNRHSVVFRNMIRGNFRKVHSGDFRGDPGSLTPLNPLDPAEVDVWLEQAGLRTVARRGIRTFYDYMEKGVERSVEDIIALEMLYGDREPYCSLGRYQLLHCRR